VYLVSKPQNAKDLARASLLDMLKVVFTRMESYDAVARSNLRRLLDTAKKSNEPKLETQDDQLDAYDMANLFSSQYHTDAYLLFRALCKLSAKTLPEEDPKNKLSIPFPITTATDPLALNSKVLSLELILTVFDNRGESFRKNEKFIYAVQNYLCVSLLKNCMSVHTDVAYLSLKLFIVLVRRVNSFSCIRF
jgi:brefeldin A-inhibited guanine nucleotide-exchange protein